MKVSRILGLIQLFAVSKTAYDKVIMFKLAQRLVAVLIVAIVAALLIATLLVGVTYFAYYAQVTNGIAPLYAMAQTGLGLAAIVAIAVGIVVAKTKKLVRDIAGVAVSETPIVTPVVNKVSDVAGGFLDGLLARGENPRSSKEAARKWWVVK